MNILIVHAHHEPQSFCSALCRQATSTLRQHGHQVEVSDLHQMEFQPVSDRRNFTSVKSPDYLKQQSEEVFASENDGFCPEIEQEIRKLEQADALIFSFPLWWFSVPAILKGWIDRVLAAGRVYGGGKLYENGLGGGTKRGLVLMTTGGGPVAYDGWGVNPAMHHLLAPIQHGVFWFNGFVPLEPFIAWSPARITQAERESCLRSLESRLKNLFHEPGLTLPPLADFPEFGHDTKNRFMVAVTLVRTRDEAFVRRIPAEIEMLEQWRRDGRLLESMTAPAKAKDWKAFFLFRAAGQEELMEWLQQLPLADYFEFSVTQLERPSDG